MDVLWNALPTKVFFVEVWVDTRATRGVRTFTVSIGILYQSLTIVKQWNSIGIVGLKCSKYTPPKFNMEPEKKFRFHVKFQGYTSIDYQSWTFEIEQLQ